jgi:hypothetical protein
MLMSWNERAQWSRIIKHRISSLTTGVVTGGQQNTTRGLAHANQVAGRGGTHDTILADQQLLDTVGGGDLSDLVDHFIVVVTAIATNDEEGVLDTLGNGQEDTRNEGFGVVRLLEDLDLLAETRTAQSGGNQLAFKQGTGRRGGGRRSNIRARLLVSKGLDGDGLDRHDELFGEGVEEESRGKKRKERSSPTEEGKREEGLASCVDHPTCTSGGTQTK